jgi:phage protein D
MGLLSQAAGALFGSGSTSAPTVRKPAFEVQFGNPSSDDWGQALVAFSVDLGFAPWADAATIYAASTDGPSAAPGDTGSLKAGYDDTSCDAIFTGQIEAVKFGIEGVTRFDAATGASALCRLRVNQGYEQSTAGDIVNDLAGKASVDTDSVQDGASYPFYAIDDRRNAWQHIAALARGNGFAAFFSAEGKLNFQPVEAGQPVQTFNYGDDILALQLSSAVPGAGQITVVGEGAAGSNGSDAWCWLLKDATASTSQSGSGDPQRLVGDPSLRSSADSQTAADSHAAAAGAATLTGWILTPGAQAVFPGSTIEIDGAPQDALNGTCVVERVRHRYSKSAGFTSLIFFTQSGAGGSGGGGGLGGLVSAAKGLL